MTTLIELISLLSSEERREFLKYLSVKNQRGDVKNVELFKAIAKGNTQDLDYKLYGKPNKNALYVLCNRLQDNLIDFIAGHSFSGETSEEMECLKMLLASRIFFEHNLNKLAKKTLLRAQKIAQEFKLYSILNEIFQTKIQHASKFDEPLDKLFLEAERNFKYYKNEHKLNMAYAQLKVELQSSSQHDIETLIEDTFKRFNISVEESLNYKSLFQLMSLLYKAAKLRSNYFSISKYMTSLFDLVLAKSHLADKHIFYHMQILDLMANTYFRNKDFENATQLTKELKHLTETTGKKYQSLFAENILLLEALNFNYTGQPNEATHILENAAISTPNTQLSMIVILFQQEKFTEAYIIYKSFQHTDNWYEKKVDFLWVIKKNIIEILLLIELDKVDLVYHRIKSFLKRFSNRLKNIGEQRTINFIKLVEKYYENPNALDVANFKDSIEASFDFQRHEDIFVISFYAWLKAKMSQRNLYAVTLELVNQKS